MRRFHIPALTTLSILSTLPVGASLPASLDPFLGSPIFYSREIWSGEIGGRSTIVAFNGDVLVIKGGASSEYKRSSDAGLTWNASTDFRPTPDGFGNRPTSFSSHQAGITLRFGPHAGRLLVPTRVQYGRIDDSLRGYNYSSAVYSDDGGQTWPVFRRIFDGPSAYSNLGVGRAGTITEGRIFLNYDGGPAGRNTAAHVAVFNLSWLLDGQSIHDFLN